MGLVGNIGTLFGRNAWRYGCMISISCWMEGFGRRGEVKGRGAECKKMVRKSLGV